MKAVHFEVLRIAIVLTLVMLVFATMLFMAGYPGYLQERGYQQSCERDYGDNSSYIGRIGNFGSSGTGIVCKTNGGVELTEGDTANMNVSTFIDYAQATIRGDV